MVDISISEMEKKENAAPSIVADSPKYPHGLRLCIDKKTIEKLMIQEAPEISDKFVINAIAEVVEVRSCPEEGDERDFSFELQIVDLNLKKGEGKEAPADTIYGG